MASGSESDSSSGRWWEYYLPRYFAGTVAGGLILGYASTKCSELACSKVAFAVNAPSSLETLLKNFTLLAAVSFAYCYIASAPMLTLHAARALFKPGDPIFHKKLHWVGVLCCLGILIEVFRIFVSHQASAPFSWFYLSGFFFISSAQVCLIYRALWGNDASTVNFYKQLVKTRARKTRRTKDFAESYRHLREHANAYGIIVLELLLAPAIMWNCKPKWILTILLMWLVPPAFCWGLATKLEMQFAISPEDFPEEEIKNE
jgi:hypothetical protein